jgi:hypothetical protein
LSRFFLKTSLDNMYSLSSMQKVDGGIGAVWVSFNSCLPLV